MDPNTVLRPASGVLFTELDGEAVLLDPASGCYFGLNEVGTAIWSRLDGKTSLGDVTEWLEERYEVAPEVLWEDLLDVVEELLSQGLVQVTA